MPIQIPGRILVSGNIVQDIVVRPVEEIRFGGTVWVEHLEHHIGGNGANTAYAIGKLGGAVTLASALGSDPAGDVLLEILRSAGVEIRHITRSPAGTASSVVLVRPDGARAFLHRPGVSREALPHVLDFANFRDNGCTHYHLANPFALVKVRPQAAAFLAAAKTAGLTTSMDTAWDSKGEWMKVVGPCLPHTDLLFANNDEATVLTECSDQRDAARAFTQHGVGTVALKLGDKGSLIYHQGEFLETPAIPVNPVDTTGAGDCFAGAFLAALQRRLPLAAAAELANAAGALSVSALGAITGLRDYAGTLEFLQSIR